MNEKIPVPGDVWLRFDWVWNVVYVVAFLAAAILAVAEGDIQSGSIPLTLLLIAGAIGWFAGGLWVIDRLRPALRQHTGWMLFFIGGIVAFWFALVQLSPAFFYALFGVFAQIFRFLSLRPGLGIAFIVSGLTVYTQTRWMNVEGPLNNTVIWTFTLMILFSFVLASWIYAIIEQSGQRRELIIELTATQVELAAAERREGTLQERERLAREIHDTLAQGFTSIVMHLEAAEQAIPADVELPVLVQHVGRAKETARANLNQARQVVNDLRPDLLAKQSLPRAIERVVSRWEEETLIKASTVITGEPCTLHPDVDVTLLRAVQEALANIRKHAHASRANITLSFMRDQVMLDVADDGVGLTQGELHPFSSGFGLIAMRERVEALGGEMTVESEQGEGTTLVVAIPFRETE